MTTTFLVFHSLFKYSGLIPLLIGLFYMRRTVWPLRFIFLFLVVSFGFEEYTSRLAFKQLSNICPMNVYTLMEHSIFSAYLFTLFDGKWLRRIFLLLAAVVLLVCIGIIWMIGCDLYTSPIIYGSTALFYIIGVLIYLFQCIQHIQEERLDLNPHFYLATGMLFYGASSFLVLITNILFQESPDLSMALWQISWIARILFNIFIIAGVVIQIRVWKPPQPV